MELLHITQQFMLVCDIEHCAVSDAVLGLSSPPSLGCWLMALIGRIIILSACVDGKLSTTAVVSYKSLLQLSLPLSLSFPVLLSLSLPPFLSSHLIL